MANYVLSRTSPPAHIYERKLNLGYGVKVDTSDALPKKEKKMNDVKEVLDVAEPVNPAPPVDNHDYRDHPVQPLEAQAAEEAPAVEGQVGN